MNLDLDDRQRAMLHEMGVHVWLPKTLVPIEADLQVAIKNVAVKSQPISVNGQNGIKNYPPTRAETTPAPEPVTAQASIARTPVDVKKPAMTAVPVASPTSVTPMRHNIADMDWVALKEAVSHCQACAMCFGRRAPVLVAPQEPIPCDWMVVGDPPDEAQERVGLPFVDDAGKLLDNMLRAVGVTRCSGNWPDQACQRAYLTHVLKCRPALMRAPDVAELSTCAQYLRREIALTQPKVILAMGRFAMQVLLSETPPECAKLPLGKLRGQVWRFADVPVVVTYPPHYLLRSGSDKAKAWADLCLAMDVVQGNWPVET